MIQSPPGLLVKPGGPKTQAQVAQEGCSTPRAPEHSPESPRKAGRHRGPWGTCPSRRGRSTLGDIGPEHDSPRRARPNHGPSDLNASCPGHLVDPMGPGNRARVAGQMVHPVGTRSQARVPRDSWSTQRDIGHGPEAPGKAGPPRTLGPGPESPGTAGRPRGTSSTGPRRPVKLVNSEP